MREVRFPISPEEQLLLSLLNPYESSSESSAPPSLGNFGACLELGRWSGLTPWILKVCQNSGRDLSPETTAFVQLSSMLLEQQTLLWKHASLALAEAGVESLLFKGLFFANAVYLPSEVPIFNDVDILIRPQKIDCAKMALTQAGFSQNVISHEGQLQLVPVESITSFEATHYELFPFTKVVVISDDPRHVDLIRSYKLGHPFVVEDDLIFVAVELDVHHNLSTGIELTDVWADAIYATIKDQPALAPSPTTQYWFMAARFYHEVMYKDSRKLRPILDLGRLIKTFSINWDLVLEISAKYLLAPGLFYVSHFLRDFCGKKVPAHFLKKLERQLNVQPTYHDVGDFLPKLLRKRFLLRP